MTATRRGRRAPANSAEPLQIAARLASLVEAHAGSDQPRLISSTFALGRDAGPDPIGLFAAAMQAGHEPSLWLKPVDGLTLVGVGRAWSVRAQGPGRFGAVAEAWARLLGATRPGGGVPADRAVGPLLIGGLGFTGDLPTDPVWVPFGAASLSVPELLYVRTPEGCWLTASFLAGGMVDAPAGTQPDPPWQLASLWADLETGAAVVAAGLGADERAAGRRPLTVVSERPNRLTWDRLVDRFAGAVGRGRLDKVVLARRRDLTSPVEIDTVAALRRLAAGSPTSATYAFVRGGSTFLGATPERLISTQGKDFQTVAIAGSIRHDDDAAQEASLAAELLSSDKDREEHEIVVDVIRTMLEPVASEIHVAPSPVVATFGTVQHLVTTVTGRLRDRAGILSLVGLLHPTPAVGGEPRALALELIAEHEGFERGWYAGPLGWVGPDGDGEFVVALRCAVVAGRTAALFAGCGIVADSDPAREWEESRNKMQVVASALGEVLP